MTNKINIVVKKLWSQLNRRRVVKTTVAYVVGAWILVEGASVIFPALLLPDWSVRIIVVSAILGLPIVVLLAWMFNIERDLEIPEKPAISGAQGADRLWKGNQSSMPPILSSAIASVAVLPFKDLSPNNEHKFIADGIATELHSTLAKVHRLRVASLTSSFALAGIDADVKEIARQLNVHYLISGGVECIGDHMRVIVEFDNADEGVQIWSETYDRDVSDVFSIQHEIAHVVAGEFGGARLRDEIFSASSRPTEDLDAWSLVQRARSYVLAFTPQALANAVPLLRRAIELDTEYAAAHAALASVLSEQILNGLSEDPLRDRATALESADKACSSAPIDPFVHKMCGAVWAYFGKSESSLSALRRAVKIAPFDFGAWGYLGWPLVQTGIQQDLDELHRIMERILQSTPSHPGATYWLYHRSVACTCESRDEMAVDFARRSVESNPMFPWGWMQYANSLGTVNAADDARQAFEQSRKISPALTPEHYEFMIREMSAKEETADRRLAGLRSSNIL